MANPWRSMAGNDAPSEEYESRREEFMESIRKDVREDIKSKFEKDKNPVVQFLLKAGVLEDMEVMRRAVMKTSDNKLIYQCGKKLDTLKVYISLAKETMVIQEKQAKVDAAQNSTEDPDEVVVSITR